MDNEIVKNIRRVFFEGSKLRETTAEVCGDAIYKAVVSISEAIRRGNKLLIAGNGGSAADAQHIAAEVVGRFYRERRGLPAIALTTDTSILTSIGNDYGFEQIFSRQIEALGRKGDVFLGISTSGNSVNVVNAVRKAAELGITTVGLTGEEGGKLKGLVDILIAVPSSNTPRIQEVHITIGHIICELVEQYMV